MRDAILCRASYLEAAMEKKKIITNKAEYAVYLVLFIFFFAAYLMALAFPEKAGTYPKGICIVALVLLVMLTAKTFYRDLRLLKDEEKYSKKVAEIEEKKMTLEQYKKIAIFMLMLFIYIFCIEKLGYFVSTITYLIVSMTVFKKKISWVIPVVAVGFTGVMYLVFDKVLHIMIPSGILF